MNYGFLNENEKILFEHKSIPVDINKKHFQLYLIVTDKRILFLDDINRGTYLDVLRITNKATILPEYNVVLSVLLSSIECKRIEDDSISFKYKDEDIVIYNLEITKMLKNIIQ